MILTSTSPAAAVPFTPSWLKDQPDPPVFMLRAGDMLEREAMELVLASEYLAPEVWPWELHFAIVEGFNKLGGSSAEHLVALQEADFAIGMGSGGELSTQDAATLTEALGELAKHWPAYRILLSQQERRKAAIPLVAFRRFCVGWQNIAGATYGVGVDRLITAEAMAGIDRNLLRLAGWEAYKLQHGAGHEKNSDAPSQSDDTPGTSNMGAPSKADGKSTGNPTKKTPTSRSRAGRSSSSTSGPARARKPR